MGTESRSCLEDTSKRYLDPLALRIFLPIGDVPLTLKCSSHVLDVSTQARKPSHLFFAFWKVVALCRDHHLLKQETSLIKGQKLAYL